MLGALGGFFGAKVGDFLEWLYNVFTSIPDILLILSFAVIFGRGIASVAMILALVGWTGVYRQVRAEFIKHSTRDYVRSAEAIGASTTSRMFRHILPNVSHVILVRMSLLVVGFIKFEVILSYLGLGVGVDDVSWGTMLAEAQSELILGYWWQLAAATALHGRLRHRLLAHDRRAARRARPEAARARMSAPDGRPALRLPTCASRSASATRTAPLRRVEAVRGVGFESPRTRRSRWSASRARARA